MSTRTGSPCSTPASSVRYVSTASFIHRLMSPNYRSPQLTTIVGGRGGATLGPDEEGCGMRRYVVLLRAVMPSGRNKVPMARLREVLSADGFENVRTYIQSGNVIVDTPLSARAVEARVHEVIKEHIGADLAV